MAVVAKHNTNKAGSRCDHTNEVVTDGTNNNNEAEYRWDE